MPILVGLKITKYKSVRAMRAEVQAQLTELPDCDSGGPRFGFCVVGCAFNSWHGGGSGLRFWRADFRLRLKGCASYIWSSGDSG